MISDGVEETYIQNQNWNNYRDFMDAFARYESSFVQDKLDLTILEGESQEHIVQMTLEPIAWI